jgi:GNAT superfamily N-acetyltransferase
MATYFACADGANRFALVALDPNHQEIIAVAKSDWEGETDRAEYVATVEDGWQGKGLGFTLTQRLIENGLRRSVRVFTGLDLLENAWMLTLFRDLTLAEQISYEGGVDYVEIELGLEKAKLRILRESLRKK